MENWGCVTWSDTELHRSPPTYAERAFTALVLLHEMAHMWFGDLVTMRWWDDLWLNEAFASFASGWAQASATDYTDAWAEFLAGDQIPAYQQDAGPATHAIRRPVPDVAHAFASFDAITYYKGQAVLLPADGLLSRGAVRRGAAPLLRRPRLGQRDAGRPHGQRSAKPPGGTCPAGRTAWLDRPGTDTISLFGTTLLTSSPDGGEPRRHALRIGSYTRTPAGLEPVDVRTVETAGTTTYLLDLPVRGPPPAQRRRPDLRLGADRRAVTAGAAGRGRPPPRAGEPGARGRYGVGHAVQGRAVDR